MQTRWRGDRTGSYVDQDTVAVATQSVREILMTAANLRLPEFVTDLQKKERVMAIAAEFDITDILDRRFGQIGARRSAAPSVASRAGAHRERVFLSGSGPRWSRQPRHLGRREAAGADRLPAGARPVDRLFGRGPRSAPVQDVRVYPSLNRAPAVPSLGGARATFPQPTSGLDAYNALQICRFLKSYAQHKHRTIIMSIHQPRYDSFLTFDDLMILGDGRSVSCLPPYVCGGRAHADA